MSRVLTYEAGLGDDNSIVSWWRKGARAERSFHAHGPQQSRRTKASRIPLELVNTPCHFRREGVMVRGRRIAMII